MTPFSASDYLGALQALMPRGAAWPRDPDATQTLVLEALAQAPARLDADAIQLLTDCFPVTTEALLPEWEATLGLPDPVAGPAPSDPKRRRAIVARLAALRGFSRKAITAFAGSLGYDAALSTIPPFRAGVNRVGDRLYDRQWANTVTLTLSPSADPPFADSVGDWDLAFCQAGLRAMAGAQLLVLFQYAGPALASPGQLDFTDPAQSGLSALI